MVAPRRSPEPVLIHPQPQLAGACPRCGEPLRVDQIRLPGWRVLVDGFCPVDSHRYVQDLPTGHALIYPTTLDLDTGDVLGGSGSQWFARRLAAQWAEPDPGPVSLELERHAPTKDAVLVDALDPVYGHALLKVVAATRVPPERLVLLLPASLRALAPRAAEHWVVDMPVARLGGWLLELEARLAAELQRIAHCELFPVPPHVAAGSVQLDALVGDVDTEQPGDPSVVLSLRDDRLWGSSSEAQRGNAARLVELMREEFPDIAVTAVGVGGAAPLPDGIADRRAAGPSLRDERAWLALMRGADLAIGVHGSNFLLPSALARASLELLPEGRYDNAFQATLLADPDPVRALHRHRTLYGGADLEDVTPERVVAVARGLLRSGGEPSASELGEPLPATLLDLDAGRAPEAAPALRDRVAAVAATAKRSVASRVRQSTVRRPSPPPSLPAVLNDRRGLRFELQTATEWEEFAKHGGHFEAAAIELAIHYLEPGMTALDIGANIGAFAAALGRAVAPSGRVFAFEPWEPARRRLLRTLELNGISSVEVVDAAVSDVDASAELFSYGEGFDSWSTLRPREINLGDHVVTAQIEVTVPSVTLDRWCTEHGIGGVDLLKVDVEGAEPNVLRGAERLFADGRVGVALVEVADTTLEPFGDRAHRLLAWLEQHGYWTFLADDERGLVPFRVAGRLETLANVVAAGARGRERLRELRLLP